MTNQSTTLGIFDSLDNAKLYQMLFNTSPLAYIFWDVNFNICAWNPYATETFGWVSDEVINQKFFPLLFTEDLHPEATQAHMLFDEGAMQAYATCENLTKSGEMITCEWHHEQIHDANGKLIGIVSMASDVTEKLQTEQALHDREQTFQAVLDTIPVRVFWKDLELNYLGCNTLFAQDAGLSSSQEIIGTTDYEFFPSEAELYRADDRHVIDTEEVRLNFEERQTTPDGSVIWLRTSKIPLRSANNQIIGVLGTYEDITEKKEAERRLRESEQMLHTVLDTIPVRVFWKDQDLNYLGCNTLFAQDAGLSSSEKIVGITDYDIFPSEAELYRGDDRHVIDTEEVRLNFEESQTTPDGSTIWLNTSKIPLRNTSGEIIGVLGTYEDITVRKMAEQQLQESERRIRAIIDNSPMIVFSLDKDGVFTLSEGMALKSIGLESGQVVGMNALDVYATNEVVLDGVKRALQGESIEHDSEVDGTWFNSRYTPVFDDDGNLVQTIGVAHDITVRKTAEQERERVVKELEDAILFKDQFLATMSHELRTPLNAVIGYSGIAVIRYDLQPEVEHMFNRIKTNSQRLLGLINDILDLSRINASRAELVHRPIQASEMITGWHEDFNEQVTSKGLGFMLEIDPELPDTIIGDEERLSQIAHNLLNNALKFTEQGEIRLIVKRVDDENWSFMIRDTGIGIPDTWQHLIFDEFRQVDGTSIRKYGGAGLGLSIVQKLCRLMDGTVQLTSQLGEGSTFTITLPLSLPEEDNISSVES